MAASPPEPLAVVDVHRGKVIIRADRVTWGETTLSADSITGIRYGIVLTKVAGVVTTGRLYRVDLTDGTRTIRIDPYNLFVGGAVEDRFKQLLNALWQPIVMPLIARMVDSISSDGGLVIEERGTLAVGRLRIDRSGLQWAPGRVLGLVERGGDFLHWRDYQGHSLHQGRIYIFGKRSKKAWLSFDLLETWNAVCLGHALSAAVNSGRVS